MEFISENITSEGYLSGRTLNVGYATINNLNVLSVTGISTTDYYVTGGTYSNGTLTLDRQNGSVIINGFFTGGTSSGGDTYVTGFTYNDAGLLVLSQNNGQSDFNVLIDTMTGLTFLDQIFPLPLPAVGSIQLVASNQNSFSILHVLDSTGAQIEVVRDNLIIARNNSGGSILKGSAVYILGSTGQVPQVELALASDPSKLPALGIMFEDTPNSSFGRVTILGNVESLNLSAFSDGDTLYVSPSVAGGLTNIKPTYPNHIQSIGTVLNNGIGNGVLQVFIRPVQGVYNNENAYLNNIFATSISATTYYNLPTDIYVTGGTYSSGTLTLDRQDGSVIITGFTSGVDNYVTGGTYDNNTGILTLDRQNGSVLISGFFTGATDLDTYVTGVTFDTNTRVLTVSQNAYPDLTTTIPDNFVTGGTYSNGILTLDRQNGSTTISGLMSADTFTTGVTFNTSTKVLTISRNQGQPDLTTSIPGTTGFTYDGANTFTLSSNGSSISATINTVTGLTVNGALIVNDGMSGHNLTVTGLTTTGTLKVTTSPVAGYVLTSDVDGNATWLSSPTLSSGSTKMDMQSVSANTSVTSTNNSSTWVDVGAMTITAKNLGSTATTYNFSFSCSAALSANAGNGNFRLVLNGNPLAGTNRQATNAGAAMAGAVRTISIDGFSPDIKTGDIIKVQFNSPTGQWTVTDRVFSIIGILTINTA